MNFDIEIRPYSSCNVGSTPSPQPFKGMKKGCERKGEEGKKGKGKRNVRAQEEMRSGGMIKKREKKW